MSNKVICPLCKEDNLKLISRKVRFNNNADVYCCQGCSLIFLDQGSFKYPKDFYEKEYHQTYITHVEPEALDPEAYFKKMLKSTKIWADKVNKMLTGKETVLDVGCSTGHFLELIRDKAKAVYGYELNKKEVSFCRESLGLDVSDEPLEKRFDKGTFDFITMIYVLEHIAEPVDFLNHVKQFLKSDGKLIVLVPNAKDPLVNFYDIPEFKLFYFCIEHLFYFTPKTLKVVFELAQLDGSIKTLQEYPLANHLNWGFRCKPTDTLASRSGLPDIKLQESALSAEWKKLWESFDIRYKEFLAKNGYGDRLWAVVGGKE
ncbi:MAG: class I SAM-dependent methyltransferase [Deltaproteobacteria bacterium]|nr:class I SAM-dependent methyltransferase [Deltaproteobacteria bacterium]